MDLNLSGKTVIITGGGRGIGRAITLSFAREGANVAIADIVAENAERVAGEAHALGSRALAVPVDVGDFASVSAMAKQVAAAFGTIDVLVNDAAIFENGLFAEGDPASWEKLVRVCYLGVLHCSRAVLDYMIPQRSGVILSVASDAGRAGEPRQAVYSGAKAAVIGFSKALAKEVGRHNIRVNVLAPAMTLSNPGMEERLGDSMPQIVRQYPLRRLGDPQDHANAITFLASDAASYITGQTLSVNGGFFMP